MAVSPPPRHVETEAEKATRVSEHEASLEDRRITSGPVASLARIKTFESLQYKDYLLVWLGQVGTSAGQWMDQVTRGYLMYELTGSALQLGAVAAARALPMLFFSVIAGAVADRSGRKMQLVVAQVGNAILNVILVALVVTGQIQPWHIYATALLAGLAQAFQQPARQSMISDFVPHHLIRNAVGLNSIALNASRSIGPAIAGGLIAAIGSGGSYAVQAVMYAVASIWTFQILDVREGPEAKARKASGAPQLSIMSSTMEGMRYIWGEKTVRAVILVVLVPSLLAQPYISLLPLFASDVLKTDAAGQGFLLAALGIGALFGAVMVASVGAGGRQGLLMLVGSVLFSLSIFAFGSSQLFAFSLGLMAMNGLFQVAYNTQAQAILQTYTPTELRGRVMGVYLMTRGLIPLGSLLIGALASWLGGPLAVQLMGGTCAVLCLWALIARPELRALR